MKQDYKKTPMVLLVEDDPLLIRSYQQKFIKDGYKVTTAFDGESALTQVIKERPDIILLDMAMPRMDGVKVLKTLKGDDKTKDIPVIILTNLVEGYEEVAEKMIGLGALDYLGKKDTTLKQLSERVRKAIETGK